MPTITLATCSYRTTATAVIRRMRHRRRSICTSKEAKTFRYDPARPHVLATVNGSATGIVHDDNGNRLGKSNTTTYEYDPEGRLTEANNLVRYKYDYSGKRVLRIDSTNTANPEGFRYFTPEVETRNMPNQYWGRLTKHYFFGGVRVASRDVGWSVAPVQYASAESVPPVTIVASASGWGYEVRLRPDVQQMGQTLAFVGFVALVFMPDRRRRKVVGIRLRRGPTIFVVGLWTMGTFPGPFYLMPTQPAWANGGGGGSAPPKPAEVLRHFHYDHLGSLQVMTTAGGSAAQYIRYKPFGEERGRFNAALQAANPNDPLGLSKYTFTGYEQDGRTGLQYANARWYDPELGQFATHDPQRQFASPYNYGAWDPTNLTDPSGESIEIAVALIAVFAVAAGIDAGIQTGDPMEGFKAFGINLGIGLLGAGVGSVVGPVVSKVPATLRLAATLSLGSYGVVSSVRNGAYVSAAATFGNMLYSAYGIENREPSPFDGQFNEDDPKFRRIVETARDGGALLNDASVAQNAEMTSLVLELPNGEHVFTSPVISDVCPADGFCTQASDALFYGPYDGYKIITAVHAHGAGLNPGFQKFGPGDIDSFGDFALNLHEFHGQTDYVGTFLVSEHSRLRFLPAMGAYPSDGGNVLGIDMGPLR